MVLKLDPRYPLVWRTPTSAQIGVDPARVVLTDVTPAHERMLGALSVGVSEPGLTMIAGGDGAQRDALLARLAPVLIAREAGAAVPAVAVSGSAELTAAIAAALSGSGVRAVTPSPHHGDARPAAAVVTGSYVLDPALHGFWLRRDVPHLPVVIGDAAATIGPFIEPGVGPCLLCLELHRRDADASWPAIATQLLGRRSPAESAVVLAETAGAAGRAVLARLSDGPGDAVSTRIDAATGERTEQTWLPHPDCGCRGVDGLVGAQSLSSGRRGSGWADAGRRGPARSTTS